MTASGGQQQSDAVARRGLMLVLSSPSGAGKTTLSRRLLDAARIEPTARPEDVPVEGFVALARAFTARR